MFPLQRLKPLSQPLQFFAPQVNRAPGPTLALQLQNIGIKIDINYSESRRIQLCHSNNVVIPGAKNWQILNIVFGNRLLWMRSENIAANCSAVGSLRGSSAVQIFDIVSYIYLCHLYLNL